MLSWDFLAVWLPKNQWTHWCTTVDLTEPLLYGLSVPSLSLVNQHLFMFLKKSKPFFLKKKKSKTAIPPTVSKTSNFLTSLPTYQVWNDSLFSWWETIFDTFSWPHGWHLCICLSLSLSVPHVCICVYVMYVHIFFHFNNFFIFLLKGKGFRIFSSLKC